MDVRLTRHAEEEISRRGIARNLVDAVLREPQQIVPASAGRKAYQSKIDFGGGRILLLRAIVDDRTDPPVVITIYRTSKIEKYWSNP